MGKRVRLIMAKPKTLTPKIQRFIDCYDGDIRSSAEKAGISYGYGKQIILLDFVYEAIRKREEEEVRPENIADRQERQKFWTEIMRGGGTILTGAKLEDITVSDRDQKKIDGEAENRPVEIVLAVDMGARLKASELLGRSECDFSEKRIHEGGEEPIKHDVTHYPAPVTEKLRELFE